LDSSDFLKMSILHYNNQGIQRTYILPKHKPDTLKTDSQSWIVIKETKILFTKMYIADWNPVSTTDKTLSSY
jgi:hypothetical protein